MENQLIFSAKSNFEFQEIYTIFQSGNIPQCINIFFVVEINDSMHF